MNIVDLQHGDVLLYENTKRPSFYARCIRLIEGSKFVHCSITMNKLATGKQLNCKLFLEQLSPRMLSVGEIYAMEPGEKIFVVRPLLDTPGPLTKEMGKQEPYGYACIFDSLINHFIALFYKKWQFRSFLTLIFKHLDCAALVAKILNSSYSIYFENPYIVEPDDFYNDEKHFKRMGYLDERVNLSKE